MGNYFSKHESMHVLRQKPTEVESHRKKYTAYVHSLNESSERGAHVTGTLILEKPSWWPLGAVRVPQGGQFIPVCSGLPT